MAGSKKLPAFQFYPGDWRKDPGVQSLDFHDRGVWFEMLCYMHESEERGVLLLNGHPMDESALARLLGLDKQILTTTLTTLLTYGVATRREEDGAIICRRMVRDEQLRQVRQSAGKKGGNPNLLKQNSTTQVNQKPTPSSSSSISSSASATEEDPPAADSSQAQDRSLDERRASVMQPDDEIMFLAAWEAAEGRARYPHAELSTPRRTEFIRLKDVPTWNWQAALAKFPLRAFQGPDSFLPTIGWFLEESTVENILEGKYDWKPNGGTNRGDISALDRYAAGDDGDDPGLIDVPNFAEKDA